MCSVVVASVKHCRDEIGSSPNYLIIFVHGLSSNKEVFECENGLKEFLEDELGLEGYVYDFAYDFSNNRGSIISQAKELGDSSHPNPSWTGPMPSLSNEAFWEEYEDWSIIYDNQSWISQSKEYFKAWFKWQNPHNPKHNDPTPAQVPEKVILLCHSMGGLSSRYYITSDFYQNDVLRVITLDTPHIGSDLITYLKRYLSFESLGKSGYSDDFDKMASSFYDNFQIRFKKTVTDMLKINTDKYIKDTFLTKLGGFIFEYPKMHEIYQGSAGWVVAAEHTNMFDINLPVLSSLNGFTYVPAFTSSFLRCIELSMFSGDGFNQMDPESQFINDLKHAEIKDNSDDISFRLVSARGAPTPHRDLINKYYMISPYLSQQILPFTNEYNSLNCESQKYWSLLSSMLLPGVMTVKDGSIVVSVDSSRGEGVDLFNEHDTQRYEIMFKNDKFEAAISVVKATYDACLAAYTMSNLFGFGSVSRQIFVIPQLQLTFYSTVLVFDEFRFDPDGVALISHMVIPRVVKNRKDGQPSIIEQTLDDIPLFGGSTVTGATKSNISAASVATTTASFNDYDQTFALLSNLDHEGNDLGVYHTVTIEAFSKDGTDTQIFPIDVDGEKKWVSAVTVKEAPTAVKGVINTYLPQKMKQFQYSENFAAWKDVGEVDRWGNFTLIGLKLAEGQNVIAFRATTWTGIKSNQHLKIILNTIPMVPSELSPLPGTYTNDNTPTFSGKFAKAAYSGDPLENVSLESVKLIMGTNEADVTSQVRTTIGGETYDKHMVFEFTPDSPLTDGDYSLVVTANSNVGISQAVMNVAVDTKAPTIAMDEIGPYSPRAPTTIKYTASDEASPNLLSVYCHLFDLDDNLLTTIASADSLSKGENFFTWDGHVTTGDKRLVGDGNYKIIIKAIDLAGNHTLAEKPIQIDSTPPTVVGVGVDPQPMTSDSSKLGLTARVSEKSTVIITLHNLSKDKTSAYVAQATKAPDESFLATHYWHYDNMMVDGPEDGIYRVEVVAQDEAGNQSLPRTLEAVRIDRTPPVIFGQITNPYVLANSGSKAYQTKLSFNINESNDVDHNQKGNIDVTVKLYNTNTGVMLDKWELSSERDIAFNASDSSKYAKGAYRFQIIAKDDVGNTGVAYASCVKDGIAPVISYPAEDNAEVSGTIAIRGTAIDPDWTNSLPFKQYRVYYKMGREPPTINPGSDWLSAAVEVPLVNRGTSTTPRNISLRPLQNDATLTYLHTNQLENGEYTVLVVVDEDGGGSLSTARVINVNNNEMTASSTQLPYVELKPLPHDVEFKSDDSVKLPIGFINSVKPANVYVEIIQRRRELDEAVVFSKYFPNILGAPFIGKPDYTPEADLGYFIWSDEEGYHIRWSSGGSSHKFTGNILAVGTTFNSPVVEGSGVRVLDSIISWDTSTSGGVNFKLDSGQIMITAKIDEDPDSPSIYAENVYLGVSKISQDYLPIMIDAANQRLVDMASIGKEAAETNLERANQTIDWDGKLDTGAYVDSGTYIVRVRAEGADGIGVATDEAAVSVKTPYDFSVTDVSPADKEFSTIGVPDRISVFYSVSKDSIVNAAVYNSSGEFVSTIAKAEKVLGVHPNNPHSLSWQGNYPDPESGMIVKPDNYKIVLTATAKDGSETKQATVNNVTVKSFDTDSTLVNLDPIGQEVDFHNGGGLERIRLVSGDSPYYIEAKGIGTYYPPKEFTYALSATGKQKITAYPYVPFAGLMHRGFREVDTKVKVKFKIHAWNWEQGKHEDIVVFGYKVGQWYNPLAWDLKFKTREEVRWINKDDLPGTSAKGVVFKEGNQIKTASFEFNPNDWWHQNEWDHTWGKADPGSGIDSIDVQVEVYNKDSGFSLDVTPTGKWVKPSSSEVTFKGIFKATNDGKKFTTHDRTLITGGARITKAYGAYRVNLTLELEAPIAYSRLTNRFVPWVGFICAKSPESERTKDFSIYLTDINQGLGFPGKVFFHDPDAKPGDPYKPKVDLIAELSGKGWKDMIAYLNKEAGEANLKGYKDSLASSVGYDSYLSDEYIEFIPITAPEQGNFEYDNGSPVVKVNTNLVYSSTGSDGRISPFDLNWPLTDDDIMDFRIAQGNKKYDLEEDPQKYTGTSPTGTWWELDQEEVELKKATQDNTKFGDGQVRFSKNVGKSIWQSQTLNNAFLPVPDYVNEIKFSVESLTESIAVSLTSDGKNGKVKAEDTAAGLSWSTSEDLNLQASSGLVKSGPITFNENAFLSRRQAKISNFYNIASDYQSAQAFKYTFLKYNPFNGDKMYSPVDNPNVVISDWQIEVKDKTGEANRDIVLAEINLTKENGPQAHFSNDKVKLKLNLKATEARYVEIKGAAPGAYELTYFDGQDWNPIYESYAGKPTSGHLAWWNVSRLNGKYTVLLKSKGLIATTDIHIGTLVKKVKEDSAWSTYKRAQLKFPAGAFVNGSGLPQDQLVTITPVTMKEIKIRNRPILLTSGPIVEIKPSPWKFEINPADKRPTLRFVYTFEDLADPLLGMWDKSKPLPKPGTDLGLPMNIHQVTEAGDLQIVTGNRQEVEINNDEHQYVFYAPLDHFSTYALLEGKFSLSAPIVFASRYITNQDTVTIYGTAESGSILSLYVKTENEAPDPEKNEPYVARLTADAKTGSFKIEKVELLQEGANYIFVTSHLEGNRAIRTLSDVMVEKDTIPPEVSAQPNLYGFSPNGDGKYDSVDYVVKTNETGKIYLSVQNPAGTGSLINEEISAEPEKQYKINWAENSVRVYRPGTITDWIQLEDRSLSSTYSDGEYITTVYAIDEAGNISANVIQKTVVDTTPPRVLGLAADPNPFTPNDDEIMDTTTFNYKFSEPAYVTLKILRDDGALFRKHESPTEKFVYPTMVATRDSGAATGDWIWDGKGSRNELIGGEYSYSIAAEDWVGNAVSSDTKTVIVDREPTLIPYAFAEPDPFSPINPTNNYTEIKYYLARDNLKVSVSILGEGESTIKTLVNNEIQGKGEHVIRWYGDFNSGYEGSKAIKNEHRVGDGSYEFKVHAEDSDGGKPANVTNTVLVDNTPPYIVAKPVQVDYATNKATLNYNIPENSVVEVSVYDQDDFLITTLLTSEAKSSGDYTLEYEFPGDGDKDRYFKIIATDRAKNIAEKTTETFAVVVDRLQILNNWVIPSTFTPNGDGFTDLTRISYNLSGGEPDYTVDINILTETGATVKTLVENEPQGPGSYSFYWDGYNDSGKLVSDGDYQYVIAAKDKRGEEVEVKELMLVVSTRPSINLSVDPAIFSPNGDESKDTTTFTYAINYPVAYITGEALVKLEVLTSTSEAVWSKVFSNTAGTYSYQYNGETTSGLTLEAGNYYVRATAQDALGSIAVPKTVELTVDYTMPLPSDFTIDPIHAKLGTELKISVDFAEELAEAPTVVIYMPDESSRDTTLVSSSGNSYEYSYVIGELDSEGNAVVSVTARDLAYNLIDKRKEFVVDRTSPEVTNLTVSPNLASTPDITGQVSIKFNVSEPLNEVPKVYVTQNGASPQIATVSGDWNMAGGECVGKYDVFTGNDGSASINIEVTDLAKNLFVYSFPNSLIADTIAPIFTNIQSDISTNPEFSTYAQEGSEVAIRFETSEDLQFNPEVKVNGNSVAYESLLSDEYTYKYTVSSTDTEGNATISITGYDPTGNEGTAETSSTSESFVIDLANPTVEIALPETEMIANPGSFATNANPDGSDRPRSTTFYYKLAEYSKVTVKVHKVADDQTTYVKEDFNSGNLIETLVNDVWQDGGVQQTVQWDGSVGAGYADSGKYAFIVEGRDRAGNLTLKKWGGTVWIQDNVLDLREPEQREYDDAGFDPKGNPDPPFISPNGNSTDPTQKRARFYFVIDLSLDPASGVPQPPERIEASAVIADTKKVGKYSVKVYSNSDLTTLIRTVVTDADAQSGTLTWEDWDGKNDADEFVADGTYYMVVDVKDYTGNAAQNNLLKRAVVVDNTLPIVSNADAVPYYFSPGPGTSSDINSTTLSYELVDNSNKAYISIDVYWDKNGDGVVDAGDELAGNLVSQQEKTADGSLYDLIWAPDDVGSTYGGDLGDGNYLFVVSAIDEAGNSAVQGVTDVIVDTMDPTFGAAPESRDWQTTNISIVANVSGGDSGINTAQYAWNSSIVAPAAGWNNLSDGQTLTQSSDGKWYLHYRATDNAGNSSTRYFGEYRKDNVAPVVGASPTSRGWAASTISVTLNVSDAHSGLNTSQYAWSIGTTTPGGGWTGFSDSQIVSQSSEGTWYLHVRATDNVGKVTSTYYGPYRKDSIAPTIADFAGDTFNPYVDDDVRIDFTASDASPSSGFLTANISARIRYSTNTVRNLTVHHDVGNNYHIIWDGTNNSNDYENEGNYTLEVLASDGAGNSATTKTSTITLQDDQYIDQGSDPGIYIDGGLSLQWINGQYDVDVTSTQNSGAEIGASAGGGGSQWYNKSSDDFYIDHAQTIRIDAGADHEDSEYHDMNIPGGDESTKVWEVGATGDSDHNDYYVSVSPGWYYVYSSVHIPLFYSGNGHTIAYYKDRKYSRYIRSCNPDYAKNIIDQAVCEQSGPTPVDSYDTGPASVSYGADDYNVFASGGDIYFRKNNGTAIKIADRSKYVETSFSSPAISADGSGFYVAWVGTTPFGSGVYFQKIPHNFARVTGTVQGASIVTTEKVVAQSTTFEAPTLVAPEDAKTDVSSLRPTFQWQHQRANTQEYRIDLAKNDSFTIDSQSFTKSANTGSPDENDPTLYHYTYAIHEFDPGLDRDTYYWRVAAVATNESATSEAWSFTVAPELTITGVTNYPNPFNPNNPNPNHSSTKLRYKLGADADDVKIRIYDMVGSLVKEITNCPTDGEGSSVWQKYNDVEWDGKNGRGDTVVNGIYPFEVIARLGDRSISARGKIAVLK